MGCIATKDRFGIDHSTRKPNQPLYAPYEKEVAIKASLVDAIKRKDSILFEKTIQQYLVRPFETVGPSVHQKTLLHCVAEHNFTEGMALAMEYITQFHTEEAFRIINCKDAKGNTPLITCCLHNSVESLEILMKYEQFIDQSVRNANGKTAMEIAQENGSPCAEVMNTGTSTTNNTRNSSKSVAGSPLTNSPYVLPLSVKNKSSPPAKDDEGTSPRASALKSVILLTRDKSTLNQGTKLYQVLKSLETTNGMFVDDEFPHDVCSMVNQGTLQEIMDKYTILKWERPSKFLNPDLNAIKIFEAIDLNDVSESRIAGCDLYAALVAMTEYPQRLVKIFTTKEVNQWGAYSVNFLISGIQVEILLDDYFPCIENSQLLFSRPKNNELWFLLLEKAFAKLYGNYSEIRSVFIAEAFETMTGMPSSQHPLREAKEDDLWNTLLESDQRNHIICAGTYQNYSEKSRIFTVVGLYEVDKSRIIKLRNPFEDFEWEGEFANDSTKWTTELKEEVGHYKGEKANFYLGVQEFIKTFDFFSICHYEEKWIRDGIQVTAEPGKAVFFEFRIEKEMEVFISVHQKLPRFMQEELDYDISPVEIILAEETLNEGIRGIAFGEKDALLGKPTVYATDKIKTKLSEGRYILRVKIRWVDDEPHEFTLNTFSPLPIHIRQTEKVAYPNFLKEIYTDAGQKSMENFTLSNKCQFGSGWAGPHFWLYAANDGNLTWKVKIVFEKMNNLIIAKEYKISEKSLSFVVKPKERVSTYLKRLSGDPVEMRWKFEQSWE